MKALEKGE